MPSCSLRARGRARHARRGGRALCEMPTAPIFSLLLQNKIRRRGGGECGQRATKTYPLTPTPPSVVQEVVEKSTTRHDIPPSGSTTPPRLVDFSTTSALSTARCLATPSPSSRHTLARHHFRTPIDRKSKWIILKPDSNARPKTRPTEPHVPHLGRRPQRRRPEAQPALRREARRSARVGRSNPRAPHAPDFKARPEPSNRAVYARAPARVSRRAGAGWISVGSIRGSARSSPFDRGGFGQDGAVVGHSRTLDSGRAPVERDAGATRARVRGSVSRTAVEDASRGAECARLCAPAGESPRGEANGSDVDAVDRSVLVGSAVRWLHRWAATAGGSLGRDGGAGRDVAVEGRVEAAWDDRADRGAGRSIGPWGAGMAEGGLNDSDIAGGRQRRRTAAFH
jgi:hypothetical protein